MKNEIIRLGPISIRFLLESAQTNGEVTMFEFTVPAGAKVPVPHFHKEFDEVIYGVAGVMTFTVEGKAFEIGPGDSCFIPRGAVHGFINLSQSEAKSLAVITPGLLGPDFFREIAALVNAGGPPDLEVIKNTMLRHGLVPAKPG
jgi:quercetin dioxygenase-like cupin family protein